MTVKKNIFFSKISYHLEKKDANEDEREEDKEEEEK